ncbi:MAG TPA: DUF2007 domain-containing protein [Solirubrobacterales bacterium]|nr:DUF2007 domain-containing protein [Solirubrobacterales bacterium]
MEIVDRGVGRGEELVQVAYTDTREEAALVRGLLREEGIRSLARQATLNAPTIGMGLLTRTARRVYVRPEDADRARELLGEVMIENPLEDDVPEPVNAAHLADARGRRPRDYNVIGAYARACLVAIVVLGLVFVFFELVRQM